MWRLDVFFCIHSNILRVCDCSQKGILKVVLVDVPVIIDAEFLQNVQLCVWLSRDVNVSEKSKMMMSAVRIIFHEVRNDVCIKNLLIYYRINLWSSLRLDRFRDFVRVLFHPNEKNFLNLVKGRLPIGSPASDLSRDVDSDVQIVKHNLFVSKKKHLCKNMQIHRPSVQFQFLLRRISWCERGTRRCPQYRFSLWWSNPQSAVLLCSTRMQELLLVNFLYWIEKKSVFSRKFDRTALQFKKDDWTIKLENESSLMTFRLSFCHQCFSEHWHFYLFISNSLGDLCRERRSSFFKFCELVFRQFHSSLIDAGRTCRDSHPSLRKLMIVCKTLTVE